MSASPSLQIGSGGAGTATTGPLRAEPRVRTSVIVPAYNEAEGVAAVLAELCPLLDDSFEVVVVDDGSTDGTANVARRYHCTLVRSEANEGKGAAMRRGFDVARGDRIIAIDADHTYPASAVLTIAAELAGFDLVAGARTFDRGRIPRLHRLGNAFLRALLRRLYAQRRADPLTGVYGIRRPALEALALRSRGFGVETEIAIKSACTGLRIVEFPITYRRRVGRTKLRTLSDGVEIARTILGLVAASKPRAALGAGGLLFYLLGCLLAAIVLGIPPGRAMEAAAGLLLGLLVLIALARRLSGYKERAAAAGVASRGLTEARRAAAVVGALSAFGCLGAVSATLLDWAGSGFSPMAGVGLLGVTLALLAFQLTVYRMALRPHVDKESEA